MSLSLRDKYLASIATDSVSLLRLGSGFRPSVREKLQVQITEHGQAGDGYSTNNKPWSVALNELSRLLVQSASHLPLSIVLSNQFVRYVIIPAMPPMTAPAKVMAVAAYTFKEIYGEITDEWLIRINPSPDGDTVVASAIDRSLLTTLETIAKNNGCKLASIQPYLMSGFNTIRSQLKSEVFCYVQVETGRTTLALRYADAWQSIGSGGAAENWHEQLPALISREILLAGDQVIQPTIYLHAANTTHDAQAIKAFTESSQWPVVRISNLMLHGVSNTVHACPLALSMAQ